jgi:hypothetical protein
LRTGQELSNKRRLSDTIRTRRTGDEVAGAISADFTDCSIADNSS